VLDDIRDFLTTPARQVRTLERVEHRPWPVPRRTWLMAQTWDDLLFAHWELPARRFEGLVPDELVLDTFEGSAWLGITPFDLKGLRLVGTPPLPKASTFLELNARTYVTFAGVPGIWFFSLDAASLLAVTGARRLYRLPYYRAQMSCARVGSELRYRSKRLDTAAEEAAFEADYRAAGTPAPAKAGSLDYFLAERYCLYTVFEQKLLRAQIHHPPWPLQPAEAEIRANTIPPDALRPLAGEPLLHYSARQDVLIWALEPAEPA
jgi:uncharacterized protein YqjF (DUF2071 family)